MSSSKKKKRGSRAEKQRTLVLFRYLFPTIAIFVIVLWLFIPCVRYTTVQEGVGDLMSVANLADTFWFEVRQELFGRSSDSATNAAFAKAVFSLLLVSGALFWIGTAATLFGTVGYYWFLQERGAKSRSKVRALWLTLFPNRFAICVPVALMLPYAALSRWIPICYRKLLGVAVTVTPSFVEPWIIGLVMLGAVILLGILSAPAERKLGVDPFLPKKKVEEREELLDEPEEIEPLFETEAERRYYEMSKKTKEEQAERIRQLLLRHDGDESDT